MRLRTTALGLSLGIVWGLAVFIATVWAIIGAQGFTLDRLGAFYRGYSISYAGAVIGLCWGFVNGFIGGVLIAWFYNLFCKEPSKATTE